MDSASEPWITINITPDGDFTRFNIISDVPEGLFVSRIGINWSYVFETDPQLIESVGFFHEPEFVFGERSLMAPNGQSFPLAINFANSNRLGRFDQNDFASFLIPEPFTLMEAPSMVARVQGEGNSFWLSVRPVPEPACLLFGAVSTIILLRRRR